MIVVIIVTNVVIVGGGAAEVVIIRSLFAKYGRAALRGVPRRPSAAQRAPPAPLLTPIRRETGKPTHASLLKMAARHAGTLSPLGPAWRWTPARRPGAGHIPQRVADTRTRRW